MTAEWLAANQRWLTAAIDVVETRLARHAARRASDAAAVAAAEAAHATASRIEDTLRGQLDPAPPLDQLGGLFGLSPFERAVLLATAGIELDESFAATVAAAHGDPRRTQLTFGLALAALDDGHWSALTPHRPLRALRLIELAPGAGLARANLQIDERILHHLCGIDAFDDRLRGLIAPLATPPAILPSHEEAAQRVAALWQAEGVPPIVQLGGSVTDAPIVAAAAAALLGVRLHVMRAADAPTSIDQRELVSLLWAREAMLRGGALLVECHAGDGEDALRAAAAFADGAGRLIAIATREPLRALRRASVTIAVERPTRPEQRAIWQGMLGGRADAMNGALDRVVAQFRLDVGSLYAAGSHALQGATDRTLDLAVWEACRQQARPRLDALAVRIEPTMTWADLVLPEAEQRTLRDIAAQVRRRVQVYEDWGFGAGGRGLGISALFAGASGTGKTLAAEVLARELGLDLFRIDLSQIVSKYIGETEKNLRNVFDAADDGGAVLLFDEADALFGKRTEVKDSHDRYANIEVSYLLQRMETYRGVAILTTNMRDALDDAFMRRVRFVVQFPFPGPAERCEIWRRAFPRAMPREGVDERVLARMILAGGNIRSIALNAAFLAAEDGGRPLRMRDVLRAAESEYAKLGRPLTELDPRTVS